MNCEQCEKELSIVVEGTKGSCEACGAVLRNYKVFYPEDPVQFFSWLHTGERMGNQMGPGQAKNGQGYVFVNYTQRRAYYLRRDLGTKPSNWDLYSFKPLCAGWGLTIEALLHNLPNKSFRKLLFTVGFP